jgi:putative ABC transport system ATP-binding protein
MIKLTQVSKFYPCGELPQAVLKGIDLTLADGCYVAITGPSGSGKTTLMNILGCMDSFEQGEYLLDGIDTKSMTDAQLSLYRNEKIGFVFQSFQLFNAKTVLENVLFPALFYRKKSDSLTERALMLLDKVGLSAHIHKLPKQLSGGQKQRTAIARALMNQPKLILADEPTGNLDSQNAAEIIRLFEQLNAEGQSIVLVTHDAQIANRCHNVVQLCDGQIIALQ